jgi:hypothetical protein
MEFEQDNDKTLVTVVLIRFITERQVHFFANIDLSPNTLTVPGIIFADVFIREWRPVLYEISLDSSVVTQRFSWGV